ncbi:MAG: hypothetical protein WC435_00775 [Candidatus Paceibacterota bacterium]
MYFSKRNNYQIEYSGYEDASPNLRKRLAYVINKYHDANNNFISSEMIASLVDFDEFQHQVKKHLVIDNPLDVIDYYPFNMVFDVVEIYWDLAKEVSSKMDIYTELRQVFILSGSVYQINGGTGKIELIPDEELAKKINETQEVFREQYEVYKLFSEAVGNLFSRKTEPKNVVRDIYIAAEKYLKAVTGEAQYSNAIKRINKSNIINSEQKSIMEKLYAFRSNTQGTSHAGSSPEPNEKDAVWFLDTMAAQLRNIEKQIKEKKIS